MRVSWLAFAGTADQCLLRSVSPPSGYHDGAETGRNDCFWLGNGGNGRVAGAGLDSRHRRARDG